MHRCIPKNTPGFQVWVLTDSKSIRSIKQSLKDRGLFDQYSRILSQLDEEGLRCFAASKALPDAGHSAALPTTIFVESDIRPSKDQERHLLQHLGLEALSKAGKLALGTRDPSAPSPAPTSRFRPGTNPLSRSIQDWLIALPTSRQCYLPTSIPELLSCETWTYQKYSPLLLLPPTTFKSSPWIRLLSSPLATELPNLYASICAAMEVTHMAINAPIPPHLPSKPHNTLSSAQGESNTLRTPAAILPFHGHFGSPDAAPTASAFEQAFWASARQNGVQQVFAPLHTMFSKGNISEKQRVLCFPGIVGDEATQGERGGTAAVDLYAGIGYFAFMYAKAGAERVLGWDINGWSVEGFRRGAESNGWDVGVIGSGGGHAGGYNGNEETDSDDWSEIAKEKRLIIFGESNSHALARIQLLRPHIPPIRHVNCGYLPTSKDSWAAAVNILDPRIGGWVHAHENVAEGDIEQRRRSIETLFAALAYAKQQDERERHGDGDSVEEGVTYTIACEHVERVKSYAPGVMHCVFDMKISPYT